MVVLSRTLSLSPALPENGYFAFGNSWKFLCRNFHYTCIHTFRIRLHLCALCILEFDVQTVESSPKPKDYTNELQTIAIIIVGQTEREQRKKQSYFENIFDMN